MPNEQYYEGFTLPDAVELLAEHHFEPANRHLSNYEHDLLLDIVDRYREQERTITRLTRQVAKSQ